MPDKPTVTLSLHCYSGDVESLYQNFERLASSHGHVFDEIHIVHQRCNPILDFKNERIKYIKIEDSQVDPLLRKFGMNPDDKRADELTHGPGSPHYWKNHVVNFLPTAIEAKTDYVVFQDADCIMVRNDPPGWIEAGINNIQNDPKVFAVSPGDGAPCRTQVMSQQMFLVDRYKFRTMDFGAWDGEFVEGGPFPEYYPMLEGRMGAHMRKHGLWRVVLSDAHRYWHDWIHHPPTEEYKPVLEGLA